MTKGHVVECKILLIGYGNPGRLDDGLGPALVKLLEEQDLSGVTLDSDYQLIVEDAEVASRHDIVVFVDASVNGKEPFDVRKVEPTDDLSFSTHSVSPSQVMGMARNLFKSTPPAYLVGIRGYDYNEFGERLSEKAKQNLDQAFKFLLNFLNQKDLKHLDEQVELFERDKAKDSLHSPSC